LAVDNIFVFLMLFTYFSIPAALQKRVLILGVIGAIVLRAVMILIGITDVVFAVDSIPAIFAITQDPFIVMTSNIFAILGLRAMYFLLADLKERFHLLTYGLGVILVFVGTKMLIVDWIKIPVGWSLVAVGAVLAASMVASVVTTRKVQ
jgi:tellurite resistance protein TerC